MTFHPVPSEPVPAPKGSNFSSITKTIFCKNSGVVLANLEMKILEGHLPYLEYHTDALYLHPLYRMSSTVLIKKLEDALHQAQGNGWVLIDQEKLRLRLLTSAMMHAFQCIKQVEPCLPRFDIAAGSAGRLLGLAKWFYYISSQRMSFPTYSVSRRNDNMEWQNFKHWVDSAYEVRQEWANQSRELKREDELRSRSAALVEIKSEHIRRVDVNKVWRWVELQLEPAIAAGTLVTWKDLFLNGDLNPVDWTADDVDDLRIAITNYCDTGNEVMFFVQSRLKAIRTMIAEFFSTFTIVGSNLNSSGKALSDEDQTDEEKAFTDSFDSKVQALDELPPEPKRSSFETTGKFMKAQAEWSILKKRWELLKGKKPQTTADGSPKQPGPDISDL